MASLKFIQAQSFQIQASGQSIGDTSIVLQSFKLPDGTTTIVTADLGDFCFGTLEPNNGTQEEAIYFTGVTQNANGTATLTGVHSVGFNSPYTATSGLAKSHAGGATFILSNDAAFYNNIKAYIDTAVVSGGITATTATAGIVQLATQAQVDAKTGTSGGNPLVAQPSLARSTRTNDYIVDTSGTANVILIAPSPVITTYATGQIFSTKIANTVTTGATLNVNSLGAVSIRKNITTSLASGDLVAGQIAVFEHDGTNFQVISPLQNTITGTLGSGASQIVQLNSSGQLPAVDGSLLTNISAQKLLTTLSSAKSTSSTTELTVVSFSVPGNTIGTTGAIRIKFNFSISASSNSISGNFRLKYGGTTLIDLNLVGGSSANNSFCGLYEAVLYANGATNAQYAGMTVLALPTAAASNMVNGGTSGSGTSAIDSTSAQTISATVIANVGGISIFGATVEFL